MKDFFIVALGTSNTDMTVTGAGACVFTLINPDLQRFQTAAYVTTVPQHGTATAQLVDGGRMASVSYTPAPGYHGPDRFTATIEPNETSPWS